MKVIVDSYAWMELFLGSPAGSRVREIMDSAEEAYTPDSVLAEIARKYFREGVSERLIRERLAAVQGASHLITINPELAVHASRAWQELAERAKRRKLRSPGSFDGLVLGAARMKEAKVVTADPHFKELPETVWI